MDIIIVTNNQKVVDTFGSSFELVFVESGYRDVLVTVRDYIHRGHQLLSHPLSGSVKPNETPYKTILISRAQHDMDLKFLSIIESAIETFDKFGENRFSQDDRLRDDFSLIDLSLISSAIPLH